MQSNSGKTECTVHVDIDQYQRLKDYSAAMSIPMESAIHEALSDYIECCVSTRLESLQRKTHIA